MILNILVFFQIAIAAPTTQSNGDINSILRMDRLQAAARIKLIGPSATQSLREVAFGSGPLKTRWKAFMTLVEVEGQRAKSDLTKAFNSPVWFMRSAALTAMEQINPLQAKKWASQTLMDDPALLVRMKSFEILKESNDPEIRQLFWKSINQPKNKSMGRSLWIRGDIARLLSRSPIKNEQANWVKLLYDPDSELQNIASRSINYLNSNQGRPSGKSVGYWKDYYSKNKNR